VLEKFYLEEERNTLGEKTYATYLQESIPIRCIIINLEVESFQWSKYTSNFPELKDSQNLTTYSFIAKNNYQLKGIECNTITLRLGITISSVHAIYVRFTYLPFLAGVFLVRSSQTEKWEKRRIERSNSNRSSKYLSTE